VANWFSVIGAWLVMLGLSATAAPSIASAGEKECTPFCYKHPVTGEIICTPPCP